MVDDVEIEEIYLHYLNEEFEWILIGKVIGSDKSGYRLVKRNDEGHWKKVVPAPLVDGECFYTLYPS